MLAALRKDQDPARFLVQISLEMGAARARADFLDHGQVGLLLELALNDQVASPGLEAKRSLDRVMSLSSIPRAKTKSGLVFQEISNSMVAFAGMPKSPLDRCSFAVGHELTRLFTPALLAEARPSPCDRWTILDARRSATTTRGRLAVRRRLSLQPASPFGPR